MLVYKGRSLDKTKPVEVYRNLNDSTGNKRYSVRQNGLVVGHCNRLLLNNCSFIVNQKGRKRVIEDKRKNVHAFIRGKIVDSAMGSGLDDNNPWPVKVTYNPYKNTSFVSGLGNCLIGALAVFIREDGVWAAYTY